MDQDYYVDGIVAELDFPDGVTRYLVKWEDYPHTDNTWEPEQHLQAETLADWREEQARIERGESRAFDIEAWEAAVERRSQKAEAKEREAKLKALVDRRAQNLESDDLDDFLVLSDQSHGSSDDEYIPYYKPRKRRLVLTNDDDEPAATSSKTKRRTVEQDLEPTNASETTMASNKPVAAPTANMSLPAEFTDRMQLDQRPDTVQASAMENATTSNVADGESSRETGVVSLADAVRQLKPARKAAKGAGPSRYSQDKAPNIFNNWNATVRKRKQNTMPKPFKTASHAWNVEKIGRTEPEPDVGALKLIHPKDGSAITPLRSDEGHQKFPLRTEANSLDEGDSLFLSQSPPDLTGSFLRRASHNGPADSRLRMEEVQTKNEPEPEPEPENIPHTNARERENLEKSSKPVVETMEPHLERRNPEIPNKFDRPRQTLGVTDWGPHTRHFDDIAGDIDLKARQLYGTLVVGVTDPQALRTIFRGIPPPWWGIFLRVKPHPKDRDCFVRITQLCTAQGYIRDYHYQGQGYYAAGHIPDWPKSKFLAKFQPFLSILRDPFKQYGGLFFSEHYTLLVYAPGSPSWEFIDKLYPASSPPSALRFVMRAPVPAKKPETTVEDALSTVQPSVLSEQPFSAQPVPKRKTPGYSPTQTFRKISMMPESSEQERVFKDALGFDWKDLLPANRPNGELPALFLHYDTAQDLAHKELMFMRGLFQDTFHMRVYGSDRSGEWSLFSTPENIKSGVILFHTSISHYEDISDLAKVLKIGSYHCWRIELRLKPERSILQKIFPSGGAILIPDSLVLRKPDMIVRLLRWYRKAKIPSMHLSKWRIVMRPRFRIWMHAVIANEGSYQRQPEELKPYKDILAQLMLAFPLRTTYDSDTDLERPSPDAGLVDPGEIELYNESIGAETQGLEASQRNDELLVKWFGKWSLQQVDKHRKFYIVFDGHGDDHQSDQNFGNKWARTWRHVNVMRSKEFARENMDRDEARFEEFAKRRESKDDQAQQK